MSATLLTHPTQNESSATLIQENILGRVDGLMASLPDVKELTREERRGIIARYTAVLEGNFIYWMTSALLCVQAEDARPIILENLHEEIRDSHPVMLRKFAMAAHAFPTDRDALAVNDDLNAVRIFLGKLCGVQTLATMAFFESFIQKFMAYLESLAVEQGSTELEYTVVHGVCDIAHSQGLFTALSQEMVINPLAHDANVYEGVDLLSTLIERIVNG
jgi:hypothetical protein